MKKCPKCGCKTFYVSAHVVQDWKVNEYEDWIETIDDCVMVSHFADDGDIWECADCGYSDTGRKFNV